MLEYVILGYCQYPVSPLVVGMKPWFFLLVRVLQGTGKQLTFGFSGTCTTVSTCPRALENVPWLGVGICTVTGSSTFMASPGILVALLSQVFTLAGAVGSVLVCTVANQLPGLLVYGRWWTQLVGVTVRCYGTVWCTVWYGTQYGLLQGTVVTWHGACKGPVSVLF